MVQKKRILLIEYEQDIASIIKLQAEISRHKLDVGADGINGSKGFYPIREKF